MKRVIIAIITLAIFPIVNWLTEVDNAAPDCCGDKTEFRGSPTSLSGEMLFYQCSLCKKTFNILNPHNGIGLGYLWRLIFMNKTGETK